MLKYIKDSHLLLLKNSFHVALLRGTQKTLSILTFYFLVRSISKEEFGDYSFIITILGLLSIFSLPGMGNAIIQSVARGHSGTYRKSIKINMLGGLCVSIICICLAFFYYGTKPDLSICFLIIAAFAPIFQGLSQWRAYEKGKENFSIISRIGIVVAFIQSLSTIVIIIMIPGSIIWPLVTFLVPQSLCNLGMTLYTLRDVKRNTEIELESFKYGIETTIYSIFNILGNHIDKILLFTLLSPAALAIFVAAEKIPELIKTSIQDVSKVLVPRFAKHEKYTKRIDRLLMLFSIGAAAFCILFALFILPHLIHLIFGNAYDESIIYAQGLMISVAIGNNATMRAAFIKSKLDTKSFKIYTVSLSVIRVVASGIAIPLLGLWGAIVSTIIYRLCMVTIIHIIMKKRYAFEKA